MVLKAFLEKHMWSVAPESRYHSEEEFAFVVSADVEINAHEVSSAD